MSDKPAPQVQNSASRLKLHIFLLAVVLPVVLIVVLLCFVSPTPAPAPNEMEIAMAKVKRLQRVGSVALQIQTGEQPLRTGEEVYKAQCVACHATGISGAPKFGDASEWAPRLKQGFAALTQASIHGKGNMTAQGGGAFSDLEIARAVAYLANAGGGDFAEPQPPTP